MRRISPKVYSINVRQRKPYKTPKPERKPPNG
nr:MAG TPA: hypothetical protein [Caudoviricetes sp.]